ncbi:hypothetical protein DERP_013594 [Dermatophagoides pteronyssinus]|uniref:Uncharacterized protein n=1 Tax=Dermatophagoides pteronyssinus TaxID=6956 RepID=A0ABQ8J5L0_DERPT|nr:hypothetical protein DERP_013594 [Dermatophagoides pteronyssinus]
MAIKMSILSVYPHLSSLFDHHNIVDKVEFLILRRRRRRSIECIAAVTLWLLYDDMDLYV